MPVVPQIHLAQIGHQLVSHLFSLIPEVRIEVDGTALREGIDKTCDGAEGHTETATECLLGPVLLSHVVDGGPGDAANSEQKEKVSSPLDEFADAVTEGLIVSAEDRAARWSLGHGANGC